MYMGFFQCLKNKLVGELTTEFSHGENDYVEVHMKNNFQELIREEIQDAKENHMNHMKLRDMTCSWKDPR